MSLPGNLAMYAVGAIVGPYVASVLIEANGRSAMFLMIAAAHVLVIRSGIARRRAHRLHLRARTPFLIGS